MSSDDWFILGDRVVLVFAIAVLIAIYGGWLG